MHRLWGALGAGAYVAHAVGFDLEAACLAQLVETMNEDVVRAAPKA
jgi:hypothetical protein